MNIWLHISFSHHIHTLEGFKMLKASLNQTFKSIHHPWFAQGYKMPDGFLVVKWDVHTFDQIPLLVTPGVVIGCFILLWSMKPLAREADTLGMWPLSSARSVAIVQYKVSRRALEVKTDDLSPLTWRKPKVNCRAWNYGRCVSVSGVSWWDKVCGKIFLIKIFYFITQWTNKNNFQM